MAGVSLFLSLCRRIWSMHTHTQPSNSWVKCWKTNSTIVYCFQYRVSDFFALFCAYTKHLYSLYEKQWIVPPKAQTFISECFLNGIWAWARSPARAFSIHILLARVCCYFEFLCDSFACFRSCVFCLDEKQFKYKQNKNGKVKQTTKTNQWEKCLSIATAIFCLSAST